MTIARTKTNQTIQEKPAIAFIRQPSKAAKRYPEHLESRYSFQRGQSDHGAAALDSGGAHWNSGW